MLCGMLLLAATPSAANALLSVVSVVLNPKYLHKSRYSTADGGSGST